MRSFQPPTLKLRGGGGGGGNVQAAAWEQRRGMCVWGLNATFTSIVGCISRFVFPSSLFRTVVAPLFLVVDGVTVVPTSAEVALLVPLPRGGICMWSNVFVFGLPLCPFRCVRV